MSDPLLLDIADYLTNPPPPTPLALSTARLCFIDAMGCALRARKVPECCRLLEGLPAAFVVGALVRWLDFNDTWLAAEWGHPSDNLGALMGACGDRPVADLFEAMVWAYEIQGQLALHNGFNRLGFDHVILVKIASAAVAAKLLGGGRDHIVSALSNAFVDAGPLRTYRHAPNVGPRKSWAAGDATHRGLLFAKLALAGDPGCPTALTAPRWGFNHVVLKGNELRLDLPLGCYVMENILFKVAYPAEFHGQTAVEAAIALHPRVADRWEEIKTISIATQEAALRIIAKEGPLRNAADRDHCLQYMVAVALLYGELTPHSYEEPIASDPAIDLLRAKTRVYEEPNYSQSYLDPTQRSIANRLSIEMEGESEPLVAEVEYPLGHPRRREEAIPHLIRKLQDNVQDKKIADFLLDEQINDKKINEILKLLI